MTKLSEKLKFAMGNCDPHYGISVHPSFIKELEALENELEELRVPPVYTNAFIEDVIKERDALQAEKIKWESVLAGVDDLAAENDTHKEQLKEWDEERVPRLCLVGELIRNDWSGTEFDGRDVRDWIDSILGGIYDEFDDEVKSIAEDSVLYREIIERKERKKNEM